MPTQETSGNLSPKDTPFGANAVRLSPVLWLVSAAFLLLLYLGLPWAWRHMERFTPGTSYRIPYAKSEDYWTYAQYARYVASDTQAIPIIGDSVVWGQYVRPGETLSRALDEQLGAPRFQNLGLNGSHPVALSGLVQHYGKAIRHRKVLLHFNPLWLTSNRRDLQATVQRDFNHPRLVPQFYPRIPSYEAPIADRLRNALACRIAFLGWTDHLRKACFGNDGLSAWTLAHPYTNPLGVVNTRFQEPEDASPSEAIPWTDREGPQLSFEWVAASDSLQWRFFRNTLATLEARGNDVFVLVGPFNEHLIKEENRPAYRAVLAEITAWLQANSVKYLAPEPLVSELYADASHPLAEGYTQLAQRLLEEEAFNKFAHATTPE